jgi:hypothetical protein
MPLARLGPISGALESAATAVGAGVLLGGFVAGSLGSIARRPRPQLDNFILDCGYVGGGVASFVVVIEGFLRYCC